MHNKTSVKLGFSLPAVETIRDHVARTKTMELWPEAIGLLNELLSKVLPTMGTVVIRTQAAQYEKHRDRTRIGRFLLGAARKAHYGHTIRGWLFVVKYGKAASQACYLPDSMVPDQESISWTRIFDIAQQNMDHNLVDACDLEALISYYKQCTGDVRA